MLLYEFGTLMNGYPNLIEIVYIKIHLFYM